MKATKIFIKSKFGDIPVILYHQDTMMADKKYSVFIFFHGLGERGDGTIEGLGKLERSTHHANLLKAAQETKEFIVVAPQFVSQEVNWQHQRSPIAAEYADFVIDWVRALDYVNPKKVGVTGFSEGGGMVWNLSTISQSIADELAFAIPIAGANLEEEVYKRDWSIPGKTVLPIWAFHAIDDGVPEEITVNYINQIKKYYTQSNVLITLYPTGGHFICDRVYADKMVIAWALSQENDITELPPKKILTKVYFSDGQVMTVFDDKSTNIVQSL